MNYEVKVLSLKRRMDRREYITNLIGEKYPFTFFDAIDGGEMEIDDIENQFSSTLENNSIINKSKTLSNAAESDAPC